METNRPGTSDLASSSFSESGKVQTVHVDQLEMEETSYAPYTFTRSLKMGVYRSGVLHRYVVLLGTLRLPGGEYSALDQSLIMTTD